MTAGKHSAAGGPPTAKDLEAEIEQTREDLAQTVDLLSAKLDVKGRVGPALPVGAAIAVAAVVATLVWRHRRAARRTVRSRR